jgi:endonuclease/exonuclease/phosphatase family metal-dependent hydrolase
MTLRVLTLNIWQEQGPWERRLELIHQRLAQLKPDVVCLQEVREKEGQIPNQACTLAEQLGMSWTWEVAQPWGGGDEGLAILSRFPIAQQEARELPFTEGRSRRVCLGTALDLGDEDPCWIFTTHLAWRLADGVLREAQVLAAERFVAEHSKGSSSATILTGDFNAPPEADEIRFLRGLTTLEGRRTYLQDAFQICNPGVAGHTWCKANPYTSQLGWLEPDRRLDYIFVSPMTRAGTGTIQSCRIVCSDPDLDGVRCSDHFGVMAEIDVRGRLQGK